MRKKLLILFLIIILIVIFAIIFKLVINRPPLIEDDELKVNIRLSINEDIGLLLIDSNVNGVLQSGGISNADRSLLKKDSSDLYWAFNRNHLLSPADICNVSLTFTIIDEYFEPNYDNIYPIEHVIKIDEPVSFDGEFGKMYYVTITGDKVNGYKAIFN